MAAPRFQLEFYKDQSGRQPVLEWLRDEVSVSTRRMVGTALREILQEQGIGVCAERLSGASSAAACSKSEDSSEKRQNDEIALARRRLTDWRQRQRVS